MNAVATTAPVRFESGFDNSYARELEGAFVPWQPAPAPAPKLLYLNGALADALGLDASALPVDMAAAVFAGNLLPEGATPIAQAYAGHQFGGFSPQLGDGRALLLGEVIDRAGARRDIAFKGSGRTPFSRGGDGRAAVGPMLREVLIGEGMHALGIPTTRALAVAATGEPVLRDTGVLPGAVLTRVAASHLRVGTFQFFASRRDTARLKTLADYAIARHDPALAGRPDRYLAMLEAVARRQAALVARWMNVGFIHGVMNTDNMTLSGETIDYGPCAFMEAYDPGAVFSSIDHQGRYAYANQPAIARWNLARLAEALLPLIDDGADGGGEGVDDGARRGTERAVAQATEVLDAFPGWYEADMLHGLRAKLGLVREHADDAMLARDWLALLETQQLDYTLAWRRLADVAEGRDASLRDELVDRAAGDAWLARWRARCDADGGAHADGPSRADAMRRVNPIVIPRNHRVEEALEAASQRDDLGPFESLLAALQRPFDAVPEHARYAEPAAREVTATYRTFCGT